MENLENRTTPAAVNLTPIADNTLYQVATADPSQQLSNGAGQHFYVGRTNQGSNDIRRGAIKFDLSAVLDHHRCDFDVEPVEDQKRGAEYRPAPRADELGRGDFQRCPGG